MINLEKIKIVYNHENLAKINKLRIMINRIPHCARIFQNAEIYRKLDVHHSMYSKKY